MQAKQHWNLKPEMYAYSYLNTKPIAGEAALKRYFRPIDTFSYHILNPLQAKQHWNLFAGVAALLSALY